MPLRCNLIVVAHQMGEGNRASSPGPSPVRARSLTAPATAPRNRKYRPRTCTRRHTVTIIMCGKTDSPHHGLHENPLITLCSATVNPALPP